MAKKTLEKNSLLVYFEIYKEKFFKILLLNVIYFSALTVLLVISGGLAYLLFSVFKLTAYLAPIALLPLVALGPITAAVTRLCRDYVRREPGFMAEDFKLAIKNNWKQSTVIALFQYVVIWGLYVAIPFYYSGMNATEGSTHIFYVIGLGVALFVALMVLFMSYYLYMMCVTLKLKIRELFKNAAIFSFLCLLKNLALTAILGVFCAAVYELCIYTIYWKNALIYGLVISFFLILFFGFIFYTTSFFTFPSIKKYILDPYYKDHPEETAEGNKGNVDTGDTLDYIAPERDENESEYVYLNGRMVHRSAIDKETIFSDKEPIDSGEEKLTQEQKEHIKSKYKRKF